MNIINFYLVHSHMKLMNEVNQLSVRMHLVHNTSSTKVIIVMWHSVYQTWARDSFSGEEANDLWQSTWFRSDIQVEDHCIIDESILGW